MNEQVPNKPVKRSRLFLVGTALLGILLSCGGLWFFADKPKNGIRVEQLEDDLRKRLPIGSTWKEAEGWFASHGIKPGAISELGGRKIGLGSTIPNDSLLDSAEIRIELYFNEDGRLRERIIYRVVYSF